MSPPIVGRKNHEVLITWQKAMNDHLLIDIFFSLYAYYNSVIASLMEILIDQL